MASTPALSIVIPAFHEERRLPSALDRLAEFCALFAESAEVFLGVERGTDRTLEIAQKFAAEHPQFEVIDNAVQRGKGFAVRSGMLRARGDVIFYMDADLSVPLAEVPKFLAHFAAHPEIDVLAGNRQHAESRITRAQSWLRRTMGQTFNRILQAVAVAPLRDTQCGFKAFRRPAAQAIFLRQKIDGFAFDVEVLLLARRLGFGVADLPVEWINSPDSRVQLVRDSARMLRDALRVRRLVDRTLRSEPDIAGQTPKTEG
jgi:dolichyl-phosphate beta-glucosyltransferase